MKKYNSTSCVKFMLGLSAVKAGWSVHGPNVLNLYVNLNGCQQPVREFRSNFRLVNVLKQKRVYK